VSRDHERPQGVEAKLRILRRFASSRGAIVRQFKAQLYFEDFSPRQRFEGGSRTISEADVLAFSALTGDQHPIHYDAEYAKTTRFGRPIVHGLHLMSLTAVGATPLSAQLKESMIAFLQQGATFLKPVFVNDTVQSAFEVKEVERKPDREWGHLTLSATLVNQRGETVLEAFHVYRLRCRSVAAAGS
jgi:3-hydroxybutyryl-CoA dehydratase